MVPTQRFVLLSMFWQGVMYMGFVSSAQAVKDARQRQLQLNAFNCTPDSLFTLQQLHTMAAQNQSLKALNNHLCQP